MRECAKEKEYLHEMIQEHMLRHQMQHNIQHDNPLEVVKCKAICLRLYNNLKIKNFLF
jgi:hypothetical protein